jgi:hypothetical protein
LNEWAPQAAAAGIKYFALITTPESFAESTASSFYSNNRAFEIKVFDNENGARDWLLYHSLVKDSSLKQV